MERRFSVLTWIGLGLAVLAFGLLATLAGQQIATSGGTSGSGDAVGTCKYITVLTDPVSGETQIVGEEKQATAEECAALSNQFGSQWEDSVGGLGGDPGSFGNDGGNGESCTYLPGGGVDTASCTTGLGGDLPPAGDAGLSRDDINFLRDCLNQTNDLSGCVSVCEANGMCAGGALDLPAAAEEFDRCMATGGTTAECNEHLEDYADDLEDALDDLTPGEETFGQSDFGDEFDTSDFDASVPDFSVVDDCLSLGVSSHICYETCVDEGTNCVELSEGTLDDVQDTFEPTFDVQTCQEAGESDQDCLQQCAELGNQCQEYADGTLQLPASEETPGLNDEEPGDIGDDNTQGPPPGISGFRCTEGSIGGSTESISSSQVQDCLDAGHQVCAYDSNGNLVVCTADANELADAIINTGKEFGLFNDEPFTGDHDPATGPAAQGIDSGIRSYCVSTDGQYESLSTQTGVSNCLNEGLTVCMQDAFGNGECADSQSEYQAGIDDLTSKQGQGTEDFANQFEKNFRQSEVGQSTEDFANGLFEQGKEFDFNSRGSCFDGANTLQYTFSMQDGISAIGNCIGRGGYAADQYGFKSAFESKWTDYLQRNVRNGNYANLSLTHF